MLNLTIHSHRRWGNKNIDFCALARGQGVEATAVDICELDGALRTAFANVTEPTLVEKAIRPLSGSWSSPRRWAGAIAYTGNAAKHLDPSIQR